MFPEFILFFDERAEKGFVTMSDEL